MSMKIQIDLNDILTDEYGPTENLAQSIHRQVVDEIKNEIGKGINKQIKDDLSIIINDLITSEVTKLMPAFITELMDAEYERRGRYGEKEGVTSFRKEMIKTINEQMVYKPEKDRYYSDRENVFTKAIKSIIQEETNKFQAEFNSVVNKEFTSNTVALVTTELKKKFGF